MNWTLLLAVFGALAAAVRVYEFFTRNIVKLDASHVFRGGDEQDDEIVVANLSPIPVLIDHWQLEWKQSSFFRKRETIDTTPDFQDVLVHRRIDAHSYTSFTFSGIDKIAWGPDIREGRSLVLTLKIFGRKKPYTLHVC